MDEDLLIGDWLREKVLGSGSFGVVSLWRNIKNNEELAIKMCKWGDDVQLTPKHKERWSKEVEMMNLMQNKNIVGTIKLPKELETGLVPSNVSKLPILCMEYCSRGDLRQVLNQIEHANGLPETQVRSILRDMKSAVSYLHSLKMTHRDLKPENIVLQIDNTISEDRTPNIIYKLIDLGYAKEIDSDSVCASFVGTLQYLAPELLYSKSYSNTVDYWSFGLVAFEIISGIRPFLPNLPPVQWMQYVKKKTLDNICVFENLRGEVEYCDVIFEENKISGCFKILMEKWLKIALDWDPKRRGHNSEDKSVKFLLPGDAKPQPKTSQDLKESSLVIFSLLDTILNKKILTLFSVVTYEHLSYEIDESTSFTTVQGWVERDTKVPLAKQIFITHSHATVDVNNLAHTYWNEQIPIMLYFYQSDSLVNDNVKPKVPQKLRYCLENSRLKLSFTLLFGVFTNCYYFINKEKDLFETLIKAYILRIEHLKIGVRALFKSHNETDRSMCKLFEKVDLLSAILDLNIDQSGQHDQALVFNSEYKSLLDRCSNVKGKSLKLKEAWTQLTVRLQSAARRCNEINSADISSKFKTDDFAELEKQACNLIGQVRKIPREERGSPKPCLSAVKIVYNCLKLRDILLHNIQSQQVIQKILDIHLETEKMSGLILSAKSNADELSINVTKTILEKEKLMLKMLGRNVFVGADVKSLPTTLPRNGDLTQTPSMINFKIGDPVRSTKPFVAPKEKLELESLIRDNVSLRLASQNYFNKCYEKHKSIQEDMTMDFDFLSES